MKFRALISALLPLSTTLAGCVAAAAGAGAAGAIYVIDRGAETTVTAGVQASTASARRVFVDMGITETKSATEQEGAGEKRTLEGTMGDRDITVTVETAGTGSKIVVVARKSAVTWDKDLARQILEKIVDGAR